MIPASQINLQMYICSPVCNSLMTLQVLQWPTHQTFGILSHLFISDYIYDSWTLDLSGLCVEEHHKRHTHKQRRAVCTVLRVLSEINISFALLHCLDADWHPFLRGQLRDMHTCAHTHSHTANTHTHTDAAQGRRLLWLTHRPCSADTSLTLYLFQMNITVYQLLWAERHMCHCVCVFVYVCVCPRCSWSIINTHFPRFTFTSLFTHLIKVKLCVFPRPCAFMHVRAYVCCLFAVGFFGGFFFGEWLFAVVFRLDRGSNGVVVTQWIGTVFKCKFTALQWRAQGIEDWQSREGQRPVEVTEREWGI